jgi:2-isopropylmalate synthase
VIAALARCRTQDIEEAGARWPRPSGAAFTFLATSDLHLERKLRITRGACLAAVVDGVSHAWQFTDDVEFSAEDAARSGRDFLAASSGAIDNGATINLPDTVGYSTRTKCRSSSPKSSAGIGPTK